MLACRKSTSRAGFIAKTLRMSRADSEDLPPVRPGPRCRAVEIISLLLRKSAFFAFPAFTEPC